MIKVSPTIIIRIMASIVVLIRMLIMVAVMVMIRRSIRVYDGGDDDDNDDFSFLMNDPWSRALVHSVPHGGSCKRLFP